MLRSLDFSSLHALLTTLLSLAVITLLGVGIRLVTQFTIQQRQQRMNRQINERLRALIAAYKTLGGSFTGDLAVNPAHHRDVTQQGQTQGGQTQGGQTLGGQTQGGQTLQGQPLATAATAPLDLSAASRSAEAPGADRARRIRDAVEAALSDIVLLGTESQVRLAASAAHELATGKLVHTEELVVSLRDFIREALDLDPIPADVVIPQQGPARPSGSGGSGKDKGDRSGEDKSGGGGGAGGMGGGGMGGGGFGLGSGSHASPRNEEGDEEHDGSSTGA